MSEWNRIVTGLEYDMPEVDDVIPEETTDEIQSWWEKNMDYCPDMEEI